MLSCLFVQTSRPGRVDVGYRNKLCETRANHAVTRAVEFDANVSPLSILASHPLLLAALPVPTMGPHHQSWHGVLLALVTLPPVLFALYFFSQFPRVPDAIEIHPSLASLSASHRIAQIYPEDIYEGGAYFDTPYGRVRSIVLWLAAICDLTHVCK